MHTINIQADGYRLSPDWAVVGTAGSYGVSSLVFEFSKEWDTLIKRATFFPAGKGEAVSVITADGVVEVPCEVLQTAGTAEFVIDGTRDGARIISLCGRLRVLETKEPGGVNAGTPTEDVYTQIVELIEAGALEGDSAYEVACANGFRGSEAEWLASLKGKDGKNGRNGTNGKDGVDGIDGKNGEDGKNGVDGKDGKSAYTIACENGFVGTESEWIESLKGADGTSVGVASVSESLESGGENVVLFSDGQSVTVRNGEKGEGFDFIGKVVFDLLLEQAMAPGLLYETIDPTVVIGIGGYRLKSLNIERYPQNAASVVFIPGIYSRAPVYEVGRTDSTYETGLSYDNSIAGVYLSENIKVVNPYAFYGNMISNIVLPSTIKELKKGCFASNNLAHVYYNGTVAQWGNVVLGEVWDGGKIGYIIHCLDGDIQK